MFSIKEKVLMAAVLVLGLALAGFGFYHWTVTTMLKSELREARESVGELTVAKASLETQKMQLTATIDKQNKSIEDLIKAQADASARAEAAIKKAKADVAKWKKQYDDLMNAPKPAEDDCKAFSIQLERYIDLRKKEAVQ